MLKKLILVIVLAALGWSAFWYWQAQALRSEIDRAVAQASEAEADYTLLVGRLTHRRRAGGWWRMRVARARAWGRRGRPGRR